VSSARGWRQASAPTTSTGCAPSSRALLVTDIAHLGPVELLTPEGERSLAFFTDVMGMEIEGQEGATTYLRGGATTSATASR